ncbi:hypothetical protein HPP92_011287 [Vanilla planifolia]|uniref:UspA domain-containing protein n=1 Tax=Vanilla planifolia TaxID=51239 RepID=A0A835R7C7_VANPL|nr:hypothetical protein HPP92_011590 [Vanilla planifolia]KAG0483203.1 hypothetical protein HPP92_011287 [Vanilla planifolia]
MQRMPMENQRVVVVVEEAEAARNALQWAVRNLLRPADFLTLLHVYPSTKSRTKQRRLRLNGFQLALSFKDLCNGIAEAKVEILVMEGDQGTEVVSLVRKIAATTLIAGLHDRSFLYKRAIPILLTRTLNCRILAIKQHSPTQYGLADAEFSLVEIKGIGNPEAKAWFLVFLCHLGRIWRSSWWR